jgi:hypothetical protein
MSKQDAIFPIPDIENRIFTIRSLQVMVDRDLAELYGVEKKRLNEQVKRNKERFPASFRFQLTDPETNELIANCDRFKTLKHSSINPYAFTEQGVAMISAVLRSETAVKVSIQIMNAFVSMRKQIAAKDMLFHRLDKLEMKQLETEQKFEKIFNALESKNTDPQKGVFFNGQIFDAYTFITNLIRKAAKSIILIDNYVDESVLTMLSKRKKNVKTIIYTRQISKQMKLDLKKHNAQYPDVEIYTYKKAHDRFLIIDENQLYHIGASLKDLGKKWFAFSRMDDFVHEILSKIGKY